MTTERVQGLRRASARRFGVRPILAAGLILAGLVLAGHGAWIHAKAWLAQVLLERAFITSLTTGQPVKPWRWMDTWPVARIEVPRLGRQAIVLADASGQALAFGPGQVAGTLEAGERGTAVYAAHRDTQFGFLGQLVAGDDLRVTRRDGVRVTFRVVGARVVTWDASGIDPHGPGRRLVLSTCWPLDAITPGPWRYVVEAEMAEDGR